jgi:hypothetical protein
LDVRVRVCCIFFYCSGRGGRWVKQDQAGLPPIAPMCTSDDGRVTIHPSCPSLAIYIYVCVCVCVSGSRTCGRRSQRRGRTRRNWPRRWRPRGPAAPGGSVRVCACVGVCVLVGGWVWVFLCVWFNHVRWVWDRVLSKRRQFYCFSSLPSLPHLVHMQGVALRQRVLATNGVGLHERHQHHRQAVARHGPEATERGHGGEGQAVLCIVWGF